MAETLHSRKTMFNFQNDARSMETTPLRFDRVQEYAEHLTDDHLRQYINKEMVNFRNERLEDVSESGPGKSQQTRLEPFYFHPHLFFRELLLTITYLLDL